jgi:septal ring factor EnvC (AmiA/AmiB activator)
MKKIAVLLCAAFMMSATVPAFAAEMTKEEKDQCLLASKGCAAEVDSIQKKMKKLQAEIKKGTKVYSAAEIKKLQEKLDEADKMLDTMLKGAGQ